MLRIRNQNTQAFSGMPLPNLHVAWSVNSQKMAQVEQTREDVTQKLTKLEEFEVMFSSVLKEAETRAEDLEGQVADAGRRFGMMDVEKQDLVQRCKDAELEKSKAGMDRDEAHRRVDAMGGLLEDAMQRLTDVQDWRRQVEMNVGAVEKEQAEVLATLKKAQEKEDSVAVLLRPGEDHNAAEREQDAVLSALKIAAEAQKNAEKERNEALDLLQKELQARKAAEGDRDEAMTALQTALQVYH